MSCGAAAQGERRADEPLLQVLAAPAAFGRGLQPPGSGAAPASWKTKRDAVRRRGCVVLSEPVFVLGY